MADDDTAAKPGGGTIEVPLDAWVKGGTQSWADEVAQQKMHADAEKRRREQDAMYGISQKVPGEARLASMKLGGASSHPSIVLWLKVPKEDEPQEFMLCELSSQEGDRPGTVELILMMQCPRCIQKRGHLPEQSIFHIRQSNRMFYFDQKPPKWLEAKWKGSLWINPKDPRETCLVAGTIHMHEHAHCPVCDWTFAIDDSIVHTIR